MESDDEASVHARRGRCAVNEKPELDTGDPNESASRPQGGSCLVISAHDFRTPRRSSLHFITDELATRGETRFFSLRFSALSRLKGDPRLKLSSRANRKEWHNGVECFLWKTLVHPVNTRIRFFRPFENILFRLHRARPHPVLVEWIKGADTIIFESGLAVIYFDLACKLNPAAKKLYRASDDLSTINVADYVQRIFDRAAPEMTSICMLSPLLAQAMPHTDNLYYVPNGINPSILDGGDPSPYEEGINAVSIGSMLFDPTFFEIASDAFPEITFHVIGSGMPRRPGYGANVKVYGDMKYSETISYIKHANFGVAPYQAQSVPEYLSDSSMKLLQYDVFGVPAVCPRAVVGSYASRVGYDPGDAASIVAAIRAACAMEHKPSRRYLNWAEVTDRLLDPQTFADTRIELPITPLSPRQSKPHVAA